MADIIFKNKSVQVGHRVKIPQAIVDTLDLKVKQKLKISFDVETKKIVVEVEENEEKKK
jgi:hypothetical protein